MENRERTKNRQFESMLNYGIAAVKGRDMETAKRWLEKASRVQPGDARSWLWLSATTDEVTEKQFFLERAVAAEPSNAAARRGLVMLSEKIDKDKVLAEGQSPIRPFKDETQQPDIQIYQCPECGGQVQFEPIKHELCCNYCGYSREIISEPATDSTRKPIDYVLPTTQGHRWAEMMQRLVCQNCGSTTLTPPGQRSDQCPYCGSNRFANSIEQMDLIDPQAILLMRLDKNDALKSVSNWLQKGTLTPDDLRKETQKILLRPGYYPFWIFDGTLEIPWRCEVNEGTNRNPRWIGRSGTEFKFFDDILVSGLKAIPKQYVAEIDPFPIAELALFTPEYLSGWQALNYDLALADASLTARERVIKNVRLELSYKIEAGEEKRNISTGAGKWSGMAFQHILLPLWIGTYQYQGKQFNLLVNGVTGKTAGEKPRDSIKVALIAMITIMFLVLTAIVVIWISNLN